MDFKTSPSVSLAELSNAVFGFETAKQLSRESHLKHKWCRMRPHLGGHRVKPLKTIYLEYS